jgi:hypothetical protein
MCTQTLLCTYDILDISNTTNSFIMHMIFLVRHKSDVDDDDDDEEEEEAGEEERRLETLRKHQRVFSC